jgi:hypothetical protein
LLVAETEATSETEVRPVETTVAKICSEKKENAGGELNYLVHKRLFVALK